jgi:hypothetical protein
MIEGGTHIDALYDYPDPKNPDQTCREKAGRDNGFGAADCRRAARRAAASYRKRMAEFSEMGPLEVWYSRVSAEEFLDLIDSMTAKRRRKPSGRREAATIFKPSLSSSSSSAEGVLRVCNQKDLTRRWWR